MTPGKFDLDLYRGDSYDWRFTLWSDTAQTVPADLTGATVKCEIREASAGVIVVPLGAVIVQPNFIDVSVVPADYATIPSKGVWDLQITGVDTKVHTVVAGAVNVTGDVTDSLIMAARRTPQTRKM